MKKLISEDNETMIFVDYFEDIPVRILVNKLTGDIRFDSDDVAKCLGYGNLNNLLGSDEGLDIISGVKKEYPDKQLFGEHNSGAFFEKY